VITSVNQGKALSAGIDLRHERRPILRRDKVIDHLHLATGVVGVDAIAHGQAFALSQGVGQGVDLPIDVGLTHVVHVDEGQAGHAAAGQGFTGPGPHTTEPHHHHVGLKQALSTLHTIEPAKTTKAPLELSGIDHCRGKVLRRSRAVLAASDLGWLAIRLSHSERADLTSPNSAWALPMDNRASATRECLGN